MAEQQASSRLSSIAPGAYGPGTWIRELATGRVYPDDLSGEVHNDGQIWSSFLWDVREEWLSTYGAETGLVMTDELFPGALEQGPTPVLTVLPGDCACYAVFVAGPTAADLFGDVALGENADTGAVPLPSPPSDTADTDTDTSKSADGCGAFGPTRPRWRWGAQAAAGTAGSGGLQHGSASLAFPGVALPLPWSAGGGFVHAPSRRGARGVGFGAGARRVHDGGSRRACLRRAHRGRGHLGPSGAHEHGDDSRGPRRLSAHGRGPRGSRLARPEPAPGGR